MRKLHKIFAITALAFLLVGTAYAKDRILYAPIMDSGGDYLLYYHEINVINVSDDTILLTFELINHDGTTCGIDKIGLAPGQGFGYANYCESQAYAKVSHSGKKGAIRASFCIKDAKSYQAISCLEMTE